MQSQPPSQQDDINNTNNHSNAHHHSSHPLTENQIRSLEKLEELQAWGDRLVTINMPSNTDSIDVTISENLEIKSIKPTSCVLYDLIIGDTILNINGQVPTNPEEAITLIKKYRPRFHMMVSRPKNRDPVHLRRATEIGLKRNFGYSYFVITLEKVGKLHLGLGIRAFRNKILVNRTDPNSLADFAYAIGDAILDVNGEKVVDVAHCRKRIIDYLKRDSKVSTVVERAISANARQNTKVIADFLTDNDPTEYEMAPDVQEIMKKQVAKFRSTCKGQFSLKGIYRGKTFGSVFFDNMAPEAYALLFTPPIQQQLQQQQQQNQCNTTQSIMGQIPVQNTTPVQLRQMPSGPKAQSSLALDREKSKSRRLKTKKFGKNNFDKATVTFAQRHIEKTIGTDVKNLAFLQKVNNQRTPNALTFMPAFFSSFTKR